VLQTVELDRGAFACTLGGVDGKTLYITAAHWPGMEAMLDAPPGGRLLAFEAPAARAGRP
jgi:sugar lactone lactonase YvrE